MGNKVQYVEPTMAEKIIYIEEEYNNRFYGIIKSFAEANCSMSSTADTLCLCRHSFIRMMRRMGWDSMFKQIDHPNKKNSKEIKLKFKEYPNMSNAHKAVFDKNAFKYKGHLDTLAGHARRLGISYHAAKYRRRHNQPLEGKTNQKESPNERTNYITCKL